MGKGLLIIVMAALTGTAILVNGSQRIAFESEYETSKYEGEVIVREIARSAMNRAISEAKRDFANAETIAYDDISYQHGHFDVTAERESPNTVVLQSVGYYSDFEYTIRTTLTQISGLDAVLNIDTEDVDATYNGNSFMVDGRDTNPPSEPGGGASEENDKHGIHTLTAAGMAAATDALAVNQHDQVIGVSGEVDVISGAFTVDFEALYEEAKASATQTISDGKINGNWTFGSPSEPEIVYVEEDLRINGNATGYGVLVVDGNVDVASGNMTWEGLVIGRNDAGMTFDLGGNASIYGAVVLLGRDPDGVETEYRIRGNGKLYYSSVTIDRVAPALDALNDGGAIVIADQWQSSGY